MVFGSRIPALLTMIAALFAAIIPGEMAKAQVAAALAVAGTTVGTRGIG
jgi:hypothetical protein